MVLGSCALYKVARRCDHKVAFLLQMRENFGVRLTADSLEQHLDRTRQHQKLYQAAHPETRARLAQLYQGISKR